MWDDLGGLSDGDLGDWVDVLVVLHVTDVHVFVSPPSSVVTETCEGVSLDSDWEFVEPQSSSFSKKYSFVWAISQEEMRYEPPASRRRMMPSAPQQSSHSSIEDAQWQTEMEVQGNSWNDHARTVTARMEQYLITSDCLKLEKCCLVQKTQKSM